MQSNEELLQKGRDILNNLIIENIHKKDKSFISVKELEILSDYEANLIDILDKCPPGMVKRLIDEIGCDIGNKK
jgi:hypothetical protein